MTLLEQKTEQNTYVQLTARIKLPAESKSRDAGGGNKDIHEKQLAPAEMGRS